MFSLFLYCTREANSYWSSAISGSISWNGLLLFYLLAGLRLSHTIICNFWTVGLKSNHSSGLSCRETVNLCSAFVWSSTSTNSDMHECCLAMEQVQNGRSCHISSIAIPFYIKISCFAKWNATSVEIAHNPNPNPDPTHNPNPKPLHDTQAVTTSPRLL